MKKSCFLALGCLTALWAGGQSATVPSQSEETPVVSILSPEAFLEKTTGRGGRADFVFGDDRPFAECHASTIVENDDRTLCCAWFGGTEEKNPDVGIWLSRFLDGAWSAPVRVAKVGEIAHWNPVLFRDPKQGLFLFFKAGAEIPYWQTYWMKSADSGANWSVPVELVPGDKGGRGPVKNKPILLSDGRWLAPASTELGGWRCFMDRSTDGGQTWTRAADIEIPEGLIKGLGAIQPTLWESQPGKVHALMRTTGGWVIRSDSEDYGTTWSRAYKTDLPNNNSGIDALKLEDGRVLLVYNPVGKNWGGRSPLTLAMSSDNGATWTRIADLENEPKCEFSYPAIVRTAKGVAISYTWKRQRIRAWQIPLAELSK